MGPEGRQILTAEDDPHDTFFLKRAFEKAGLGVRLSFVRDGQEAIDYLEGKEQFRNRAEYPMPELMFLDLKMPRLNGFDVLQWVRQHDCLRRLPIVVFTSSEERQDVNRAYELGANSYLTKPSDLENLEELMSLVRRYWLESSKVPDYDNQPSGGTTPAKRNC